MCSTISSRSGGRPTPRRARHRFHLRRRELPMPAKQGLGRDEEAPPPPSGEQPAEHREDRSVRGPVADAAMELTLEHSDLVAEHHQLYVLVQSCPPAGSQQAEDPARDEVAQADGHGRGCSTMPKSASSAVRSMNWCPTALAQAQRRPVGLDFLRLSEPSTRSPARPSLLQRRMCLLPAASWRDSVGDLWSALPSALNRTPRASWNWPQASS